MHFACAAMQACHLCAGSTQPICHILMLQCICRQANSVHGHQGFVFVQDVNSHSFLVRLYYQKRVFMGFCCVSCEVLYLMVSWFTFSLSHTAVVPYAPQYQSEPVSCCWRQCDSFTLQRNVTIVAGNQIVCLCDPLTAS